MLWKILFFVSVLINADLLFNYLSSRINTTDGIGCTSVLHKLLGIFDGRWTQQRFLDAFLVSLIGTMVIAFILVSFKKKNIEMLENRRNFVLKNCGCIINTPAVLFLTGLQ